jgi:hypothetical protein
MTTVMSRQPVQFSVRLCPRFVRVTLQKATKNDQTPQYNKTG